MWMAIISFLGGPVIKGLIDAYQAKLKAGNVDSKIAADLAADEIAAQTAETQAITQYRIAEIGHWYEPDKLMGYFVAFYLAKLLIWDKVQPENFSLAMCEMAWCSKQAPAKIWRQSVLSYDKEHPTQNQSRSWNGA